MLPHQHCFRTTVAAALALGAIAVPAASAHPLPADPIYKPNPTIVRITTPSNAGFNWADAGIGAAGGLALAIVGIGGGLAIAQRREHRSGTSTGRRPFKVA
jgi:hypothetical protein